MEGSIIDQIDTFEVAKRNSIVRLTRRMYSMRTMTVQPALTRKDMSSNSMNGAVNIKDLHYANAKKYPNNELRSSIHLEIPDHKDR